MRTLLRFYCPFYSNLLDETQLEQVTSTHLIGFNNLLVFVTGKALDKDTEASRRRTLSTSTQRGKGLSC